MSPSPDPRLESVLRDHAPHVLGALVRRFRDFASSEDAAQEALMAAADQWPRDGVPVNPRGWLLSVAKRRMIDQMRGEASRRLRETAVAEDTADSVPGLDDDSDPDDVLILLFMCCHPALTSSSAIVLTLRAVGGLTTAAIARAFLVPPATIGRRISRAKECIRASGVPFRMPDDASRTERLDQCCVCCI